MPNNPPKPETFDMLIRKAEQAAERDVAQVGLGLESRVMQRILAAGSATNLDAWATAFSRAAFACVALVALLATWAWMGSVYPILESEFALSALENEPTGWSFSLSW